MSADTVNKLLDERSRLVARNAATEGHLFMAEILLSRAARYLRTMVAPDAALAAARDTLCEEIDELLAEDRPHPAREMSDTDVPAAGDRGEAIEGGGAA